VPVVVVAEPLLPHAGNQAIVPSSTTRATPETQRRRREEPAPNKATPQIGNQRAYQNVGRLRTLAVWVSLVVVIFRTDVALPLLLGIVGTGVGVKVQVVPASATGVVGLTQASVMLAGKPAVVLGVKVTVYVAVCPATTDWLEGVTALV